jgi:hypothetical protein
MGRKCTAEALTRTGNPFGWATHGRNPTEVVITTDTGVRARSLAPVACGLDPVVETFASTVIIRNLGNPRHGPGDRWPTARSA